MGPTRPSARRPRRCCKALTASSVFSLKTPSMPLLPRSKPRACRRVWRSTTSRPLSPLRSVRTYPTGLPSVLAQCSSRPTRERRARMPGAPESRLLLFPLALDYPQDVVCIEDHVVLAVEADLGPRVLGEDDNVALGNFDRHALVVLVELALANRHDLGGLRLLLGRVGQHYSRSRRLLALDDLDERPRSQRLELHFFVLLITSDSSTTPRATAGLTRLYGAYAPEIVTGSVASRNYRPSCADSWFFGRAPIACWVTCPSSKRAMVGMLEML